MKFATALFALMAVSSVVAAPLGAGPADAVGAPQPPADLKLGGAKAAAAGAKAAPKDAKAGKGAKASKGSKASSAAASASNSTASSVDNSASNSNATATSTDNSGSDNSASSTQTAASATRTRFCDQGDQSLAAGLQAAVTISLGQQAAVATLQNATAAADFADGQTRLQQFVDTMGLQLQMATTIADDGSFAQTQLKLLTAAQTTQETMVKSLAGGDATTSAATLTQLASSFLDNTNNALDGAEQALIDCTIPLATISG